MQYRGVQLNLEEKIETILKDFPKTFAEELDIDLKRGDEQEVFKWFLAAILFGARISMEIAKKTYKQFHNENLITPDAILNAGWDKLVEVLDAGGYVRYDFSTADKLLEVMKLLYEKYNGKLNKVHAVAKDSKDLEILLQEFRGVGPMTTNIFLRELRGIWGKANPNLSPLVKKIAQKLGISEDRIRGDVKLEAALVRLKSKIRK